MTWLTAIFGIAILVDLVAMAVLLMNIVARLKAQSEHLRAHDQMLDLILSWVDSHNGGGQ